MAETYDIRYPNYITNDEWKYRCVKIIVRKNPALASDFKELKKKVLEIGDDIKDVVSQTITTGGIESAADKIEQWNKLEKTETIMGIALPLPNEMLDTQTHKWELETSNVADLAKSGIDKATMGNSSRADKILGEISSRAGFRKPIINPGYFQNYNGTEPRNMVLNFTLIPNNITEMQNIINIIYQLKKFSLPSTTAAGLVLNAPHFFDLEIGNPYIDSLMNFKNLVITNLTVSYGADGSMQFFADGMPKVINLTLSLAERRLQTANSY